MSIALVIDWPDRDSEVLHLGTLRQMEAWGAMACELGLELIPHFDNFLPLEPGNLDQVLSELAVFRAELVRRGAGYEEDIEYVDRLAATLQRLKQSEGWDASIG